MNGSRTATRVVGLSTIAFALAGIAWFALEVTPPGLGFEDTDNPTVMLDFVRAHPDIYVNAGLITFDARGSGASDHPPAGYRFDDHVADAIAVLDASQTAAVSLVAGSLGTHVAVLLAARHPDRIARLVLIAPPMSVGGTDDGDGEALIQSSDEDASARSSAPDWRTDYPAFVPWFIGEVFSEPDSQATIDEVVGIALEADHAMLLQQAAELDWDEAPRRG